MQSKNRIFFFEGNNLYLILFFNFGGKDFFPNILIFFPIAIAIPIPFILNEIEIDLDFE